MFKSLKIQCHNTKRKGKHPRWLPGNRESGEGASEPASQPAAEGKEEQKKVTATQTNSNFSVRLLRKVLHCAAGPAQGSLRRSLSPTHHQELPRFLPARSPPSGGWKRSEQARLPLPPPAAHEAGAPGSRCRAASCRLLAPATPRCERRTPSPAQLLHLACFSVLANKASSSHGETQKCKNPEADRY